MDTLVGGLEKCFSVAEGPLFFMEKKSYYGCAGVHIVPEVLLTVTFSDNRTV